MDVHCPYCKRLLARGLLGDVSLWCRGCKRQMRFRCQRRSGPVELVSSPD